jgi:nitrogen fixation protein NifQ
MNAPQDYRGLLLAELIGAPVSSEQMRDPLRPVFASLLTGRFLNQGVLTATLGLPLQSFQTLCQRYFPLARIQMEDGPRADLAEFEDLVQLLLQYRAGKSESEVWLAQIVAHGCGGSDHLWQDLGLGNRSELSLLMNTAFPALAALNTGDMKWKKFIYRHYCAREAIYVCPAPSCGACSDFRNCFSPEE